MKKLIAAPLVFMLIILPLAACDAQITEVTNCIPPATDFAYKASSEGIGNYPEEEVLPPPPWTQVAEVPYSVDLLGVRTINNTATEIWISRMSPETDSLYSRELVTYRTDTKELRVVTLPKGLDSFNPVSAIYVSPDNTVWAFNNGGQLKTSVPVILSKFDEATSTFINVEETREIPNGILIYGGQLRVSNEILLDENGVFWVLVPYDFIYSFHPDTGEVKRHVSISQIYPYDATLAPDGSIYILDKSGPEDQLFHYFTNTNELTGVYYGLEPWPSIPNLLVDHSGRLWAGGLGWMETDGTWYQILRSPLFVTTNLDLDGGRVYRWQKPYIVMESSDYMLWFVAANGAFSLDPQKGEWCWFSTYGSNITEDANHTLWMIADGKLYKMPLSK